MRTEKKAASQLQPSLKPSADSEWLETNGLGDYASATTEGINTRRYHGLLVANVEGMDRHVLLSATEDWLSVRSDAYPLSSRHHPYTVYPEGRKNLKEFHPAPCPAFVYEAGGFRITKSIALISGQHAVLLRYHVESLQKKACTESLTLRISPLLAFRSFHALTHANMDLQVKTYPVNSAANGFKIQPYNSLPPLYVQVSGLFDFLPSPEWVNVVEYPVEQQRGFDFSEDLFSPGLLEIHLLPGEDVIVSASTAEIKPSLEEHQPLEALWDKEMQRRGKAAGSTAAKTAAKAASKTAKAAKASDKGAALEKYLAAQSACFLTKTQGGHSMVIAGYPWFGSWGRDTLIALPGVSFLAGRVEEGLDVLSAMIKNASDGIIPNTYTSDGRADGYNSVDASLWFAWDCQLMLKKLGRSQEAKDFMDLCAPAVYAVIEAFRAGRVPFARVASSGMVEVGTPQTQLTWMDAQVDGRPVTPRYGYPVEIQALWYNTLAFGHDLAKKRGDPDPCPARSLQALRSIFEAKFVKDDGSLYDVWLHADDGGPDGALRPNQLLAVSMPFPIAPESCWKSVVDKVTEELLTPFGLRTLSPSHPLFAPQYAGDAKSRDSAYHQGTVWPWLLGPYTDALIKSCRLGSGKKPGAADAGRQQRLLDKAAKKLLAEVTPLFARHLTEAGVGHISEIFSATSPYAPDGTIAQAWSEGEVLRMLMLLRKNAPDAYAAWAASLALPLLPAE